MKINRKIMIAQKKEPVLDKESKKRKVLYQSTVGKATRERGPRPPLNNQMFDILAVLHRSL